MQVGAAPLSKYSTTSVMTVPASIKLSKPVSVGVSKPLLAVDDRQDPKFTRALEAYFTVATKHLRSGDLVWSCPLGTVGVEDKDIADLTGSRSNGRLDDELRRLIDTYTVPILFIRGAARDLDSAYTTWDDWALENLRLGRQLHGVFVYSTPRPVERAAYGLSRLHTYLSSTRTGGMEGVRRERQQAYKGPLAPRAEVVYGILGGVRGIKGRRTLAQSIASVTGLADFLRWTQTDLLAAGFSTHMANKLAAYLHMLNEKEVASRK